MIFEVSIFSYYKSKSYVLCKVAITLYDVVGILRHLVSSITNNYIVISYSDFAENESR